MFLERFKRFQILVTFPGPFFDISINLPTVEESLSGLPSLRSFLQKPCFIG